MSSASVVAGVSAVSAVPVIVITSYVPTLALTLAPVPYKVFLATEYPQTPSPARVIPYVYVKCKDTCNCNCAVVEEASTPQQAIPPELKCCEKCCKCTRASN